MSKSHYPALIKKHNWQVEQQQRLLDKLLQQRDDRQIKLDDLVAEIKQSAQLKLSLLPELESMRHQYINVLNQDKATLIDEIDSIKQSISRQQQQLIAYKTQLKLIEKVFAKQQLAEAKQQALADEKMLEDLVLARSGRYQ